MLEYIIFLPIEQSCAACELYLQVTAACVAALLKLTSVFFFWIRISIVLRLPVFPCILLGATFWTPASCGRANPQGDTGPKSRLRLRCWIRNLGASVGPRMRIPGFMLLRLGCCTLTAFDIDSLQLQLRNSLISI